MSKWNIDMVTLTRWMKRQIGKIDLYDPFTKVCDGNSWSSYIVNNYYVKTFYLRSVQNLLIFPTTTFFRITQYKHLSSTHYLRAGQNTDFDHLHFLIQNQQYISAVHPALRKSHLSLGDGRYIQSRY
jgi:hypothetical protein